MLGRTRAARLRLLDERADDIRLAALAEDPGQALVRFRGTVLRDPARDDRLPVRREDGELGDVEVAVDRQRQRAGDRRRGHVQDVRTAAFGERAALSDAEAVLLVHDRDGQVTEVDLLLDERMRADDERRVARGDAAAVHARAPARAASS